MCTEYWVQKRIVHLTVYTIGTQNYLQNFDAVLFLGFSVLMLSFDGPLCNDWQARKSAAAEENLLSPLLTFSAFFFSATEYLKINQECNASKNLFIAYKTTLEKRFQRTIQQYLLSVSFNFQSLLVV